MTDYAGRHQAIFKDGFKYIFSSTYPNHKQYFRCSKRRKSKNRGSHCQASILVDEDGIVDSSFVSKEHTCQLIASDESIPVLDATEEVFVNKKCLCIHCSQFCALLDERTS